jgi:hypothetical protein
LPSEKNALRKKTTAWTGKTSEMHEQNCYSDKQGSSRARDSIDIDRGIGTGTISKSSKLHCDFVESNRLDDCAALNENEFTRQIIALDEIGSISILIITLSEFS